MKIVGPGAVDAKPAGIQLQMIYDRLDMSLFASLDRDERNHLLCYPRPEATKPDHAGKPAPIRKKPRPGSPGAYLVFGLRVDTGEGVRALIPPPPEPPVEHREEPHEPA